MRYLIPLALISVIGLGIYFIMPGAAGPVVCSSEAKICPDGSGVGRVGPKCEFAPCPIPPAPKTSDITLGIGQTDSTNGIQISFQSVKQDSRCPVDVQCIQAGSVTANVVLANGPHSESISLLSNTPISFYGYTISIVKVAPDKQSKMTLAPSDYRITFHVELQKNPTLKPTPI